MTNPDPSPIAWRPVVQWCCRLLVGAAVALLVAGMAFDDRQRSLLVGVGFALTGAFQSALLLIWIDGKPIHTRGGIVRKDEERRLYRSLLLGLSCLGWFAMLVVATGL